MKDLFKSRLAKKQLLFIVLFSSIITLLGTLIQLSVEYRSDINYIQTQLQQIKDSHLDSMNSSLWKLDDNQLNIELNSILSMRDIVYIEIKEKEKIIFQAGETLPDSKSIHKIYPMTYNNDGKIEGIGVLTAYASLAKVYQRMYRRIFVILATQGVKTFIVSLFILYVIHRLVIRHLIKISSFAREFSLDKLGTELKINRKEPAHNDELELLVNTMNHMRRRLLDDISAQRLAEEALKQSEERYKSLFKNNHSTMLLVDAESADIVDANPAAVSYYGWSLEELIQKKITEINTLSDEKLFKEMALAKKEKRRRFFFQHRMANGSIRDVEVYSGPIVVHGKKLLYSIIHDITERKQMEAYIQQAQKMEAVGTLAGGIAHDFNNMLGVITGNISYAQSIINKNDELLEVLTDVQQGAKQAQNLTQQLLTFARGGAPIKTVTNLNQVIEESVKFVIRGTKSQCEFKPANDLWAVEIDSGQITQVMGNLIINANQAMPRGGEITITAENIKIRPEDGLPLDGEDYVLVIVEDQGVGISDKHLKNIFDPYYSTKQKGSGLGLATAYSIIKRHGGHISVSSRIDIGTIFGVYLPASHKKPQIFEKEEKTDHRGQGKILIVDDEEAILKMAARMLNRMGYEAVMARDGNDAIDLYKESLKTGDAFKLVILDLTIPGGMGGPETISELKKIDPNVKAIVSSGYSTDPVMAKYQDFGFSGVVPKPYTKKEFARVLNDIIHS